MEIRIGIVNSARELSFDTDETAEAVRTVVSDALDTKATHLTLTDDKGTTYVVATATLAYVEIGSEDVRRVGFVA